MADKLVVGCGYLGRLVAARLRADGRRVFVTTRSPRRAEEFRVAGLEPVICDVLNRDSLIALPAAADVVYCVGFDRTSGADLRAVYVDGLANVLAALDPPPEESTRPGRFVYVSSTGVYAQKGGEKVDEEEATKPEAESGRVVLEAERLLHARRPDAVVLRFAGIYGPGRLIRERAVRSGEPLSGDPAQWLNLIHVEDGAAAVAAALERGKHGAVYNVSDGEPVARRDFYACMAALLGAPPPRFAGTTADGANRRVVNERMRRDLGVSPRYPSYREGLRASVEQG